MTEPDDRQAAGESGDEWSERAWAPPEPTADPGAAAALPPAPFIPGGSGRGAKRFAPGGPPARGGPGPAPGVPFNPYSTPAPGQAPPGFSTSPASPPAVPGTMPRAAGPVQGFLGAQSPQGPWASPAAVGEAQLGALAPAPTHSRSSRRFRQGAVSPLWHMLATAVLMALTFAAFALSTRDVFRRLEVLDSSGSVRTSGSSGPWGWIGLGLLILTLLMETWWVVQIGENAGTYGPVLVFAVLWPVYFVMLIFIPIPIVWVLAYLVYFFWPVRKLVVGIWSAANIARNYALLIWAAPVFCGLVSALLTAVVFRSGDADEAGPMWVAVQVLGALMWLGILSWIAGPFVVSIVQHLGIYKDRANAGRREPMAR